MKTLPEFTDAQFMSAATKKTVARQWERLLKHLAVRGYLAEDGFHLFPKALYDHLHLHCGYVAHFDRFGFFLAYFVRPADCANFMERWVERGRFQPWEGCPQLYDMLPDYRDIGEYMVAAATKRGADILAHARVAVRDVETAHAHALLSKHGLGVQEVRRA
jgi:hypothetical protein